ncbi:Down syndrome cell adhesion molecule-like protein Dscam2 [Ixodes scapularis]|uniref:Down syndrome cell adhesion molecule-like protein Dscam2 n=1 Tax=Ixodes scapularis TaxID=6945 RepID=UPI001C38A24F|nr:Down syndrome cell adhesion molecule-like protein Dscam2 [Ixodes scapularis]
MGQALPAIPWLRVLLPLLVLCQTKAPVVGEALPPLFFKEEPPSTVLFLNSSGAVVPCSAGGVPTPSTAWRKADGGPVLTELPGLRQLRSDGSLVFPPFGAEQYRPDVHATSYRCEASNSYGIIGSRDVRVSAGTCRLFGHTEGNIYISC